MIEYSCFVRKGKNPTCKICSNALQQDEPYCRMQINRYANPYFHAGCLINAGNAANDQLANLEEIRTKYKAAEKARKKKIKGTQNPIQFRKQIIRDALKLVNVSTQSIPISQVGGVWTRHRNTINRIDCVLRVMDSVDVAFMREGLMQIDTLTPGIIIRIPIINCAYSDDKPKEIPGTEIHLADPKSLDKLGKALISHDYRGHIRSRQKEVK